MGLRKKKHSGPTSAERSVDRVESRQLQKQSHSRSQDRKRASSSEVHGQQKPSVEDDARAGERLQKVLRDCGIGSRRAVEEFILNGQVAINGVIVRELGVKIDPTVDSVALNGRVIALEPKKLYLFNKPRGVVTTLGKQEKRRSVREFVRDLPVRVFPVGRLDADVSGLLLLTNDGELSQRLTHPSYGVARVYQAVVLGVPSAVDLKALKSGVELEDGMGRASQVRLIVPSKSSQILFGEVPSGYSLLELEVREGRHHFVKRLLRAIGHPVKLLSRIEFGPYQLGVLREGEIQECDIEGAPVRFSPQKNLRYRSDGG